MDMSVTETRPDPDTGLVIAMAAGDSAALAALMDLHLKPIKALAWHMLGEEMAAEDITQEVFLKAWMHAQKWQPGRAKFITWMRKVTTNMCLDRLRKKTEVLSDTLPERADNRQTAHAEMEAQETSDVVRSAIAQLPDRQRAAITLSHYQELSQSEAADILDITIDAYESLLARGRRTLKTALADDRHNLLSGYGQN